MPLIKSALLLLFTLNFVFAQSIFQFRKPAPLLETAYSEYAMQPKWSPDGSRVAFTGANYQGIFVYTLSSKTIQKITDAPSAGFELSWSPDSKKIAARVSRFEKGFRLNAITVFNLQNHKSELLNTFRPGSMSPPRWTSDNQQIYYVSKNRLRFAATQSQPFSKKSTSAYFAKASNIIVKQTDAREKIIYTLPGQEIINLVAAPDAKKYVFETADGNMYVIHADGGNLLNLGLGDSPAWSPDGKYIVYSITKDDGHDFTESDLYIISTDGRIKQNITKSERLEMHPDWSPDGKAIVYDDYRDGILYILSIGEIKK